MNFFHTFFQPFFHSRTRVGIDLAFHAETRMSNSVLFPVQLPIKQLQMVISTVVLPEDDRADFAQEEPLGLQC